MEHGLVIGPDDVTDPEQELVIDEKDTELDFDRLEAIGRDWEDHFNEEHRHSRNGQDEEDDKKHDAMQNMPSRPQSLHDYLTDQLTFLEITPAQMELLRFLITHIDDRGYLATPLEEIAVATKFVGVLPATKLFGSPNKEAMYTTLLMSTGLGFGTIASLFGRSHGIIDSSQFSTLVAAIIGTAIIPTFVANTFFLPSHLLPRPEPEVAPSRSGVRLNSSWDSTWNCS